MGRTKKLSGAVIGTLLLLGGLTASAGAASAAQACGGGGSVSTVNGTLPDGATYEIQCPAGTWNGTLFLYSHGYVVPGSANPAQDVGDPVTGGWLLSHGYALAGSSYATTGWAIQSALPDQISTLDAFDSSYGRPSHTIAWGHSLGGIITAGLIQDYPQRFTAALPMCGVLSGGVATWNTALDAEFAFQQLIDPAVQVVNITNGGANLTQAETAAAQAQQTPQGRARLALVSALGDTPGWFTPLSPEPAATDYAAQEANQFDWASQVTFPFVFDFRANLEADAGGNPSWNVGVNYFQDLAKSADYQEVVALYKAAGLSLTADVHTLQSAPRVARQPPGGAVPVAEHRLQRPHLGPGADHAHHRRRPGRAGERAGIPERRGPRWPRQPAAAGVRAPRRALRVHPGGDDHRGAGAAQPAAHRLLERAEPSRHERPGHGARTGLQHLLGQQYAGRGDRARVHPVPAGPVPAPVRPALHPPVGPRLSPALPAPPVPPQHPHIERH